MTCCPSCSVSFCAIARPRMSLGPPGGNGNMRRTVFVGKFCAAAGAIAAPRHANNATPTPLPNRIPVAPLSFTFQLVELRAGVLDDLRPARFFLADEVTELVRRHRQHVRTLIRELFPHVCRAEDANDLTIQTAH